MSDSNTKRRDAGRGLAAGGRWLVIGALLIGGLLAVMFLERGKFGGTGWSLPQRQGRKQPRVSA